MPQPRPLTRIIATIGPASEEPGAVRRLIDAGAGAVRLNFSHGDAGAHERYLRSVRAAGAEAERPVAVIGDLQGPKLRIGPVREEPLEIPAGAEVRFEHGTAEGGGPPYVLSCPDRALFDEAEPGHRLLLDDGLIRLEVVGREPDGLRCRVTHGGDVRSRKGINLPDTDPDVEPLTPRDRAWVRWAVEHDLDFLALSYVGRGEHVEQLRAELREAGGAIPIIAKVERPSAVEHAAGIIDAAEAVMIARGDLGVELDVEEVPVVQRQLTLAAARAGKPCIVATQMLQSMVESPVPTRAEASDVAGAIFDRVDAVMLSGETAVGRFPVLAVETMARIARRAEAHLATLPAEPSRPALLAESGYRTAALAHGVWAAARDLRAKAIAVWSQSGGGARYLSQNRFAIPILAFSSDERALRRMQVLRGVEPRLMAVPADLAEWTGLVDAHLREHAGLESGAACVLMAGEPLGTPAVTNRMALHWVGDPATGFAAPG